MCKDAGIGLYYTMESYINGLMLGHCYATGKKVLEELHEGVYSSHIGGRAPAVTAIRTSYYWPSLHEDAMNLLRSAPQMRKMSEIRPHPANAHHPLTLIVSLLPFATWGMDILGPFPKATCQ